MPPRDPDEGAVLDVLAWNSHVGNPAGNVLATLADEYDRQPFHVAVLNEVRNHYDELARWADRHGFEVFQQVPAPKEPGKPVSDVGSTAVLVHEDVEVRSAKVVRMLTPWKVFSHNRWHGPRRYWRLRLRTASGPWRVRASHWPTNGFKGGNRVAFAESATRAAAWLVRAPGVPAVDVGDHNESVKTLRAWAKPFGGRVAGNGPDSAIVVGARVEDEERDKHGSDHRLMRYRITRK